MSDQGVIGRESWINLADAYVNVDRRKGAGDMTDREGWIARIVAVVVFILLFWGLASAEVGPTVGRSGGLYLPPSPGSAGAAP